MAVPKKKKSKAKKRRNFHRMFMSSAAHSLCNNCGATKISHNYCKCAI